MRLIRLAPAVQLHKEMQEGLGQLRAIQQELRSGVSLINPGCGAPPPLRGAVPSQRRRALACMQCFRPKC